MRMLPHGRHDIFPNRQGRKQSPILEHHAPAALERHAGRPFKTIDTLPKHLYVSGLRLVQPDYRPEKNRLACPRSPYNAKNFPGEQIKIKILVYDLRSELIGQPAHAHSNLPRGILPVRGVDRCKGRGDCHHTSMK